MSSNSNPVLTINFFDSLGNSLPQFQIVAGALTPAMLLQLQQFIANNYVQAANQIQFQISGYTSSNPIVTVPQIETQITSAMNQIAKIPAGSQIGTTESSTFVGAVPGENVQFTITANNFATTTLIMTSGDFALLQQNPQSGVSVINPVSTTAPPTISYASLESQLVNAGVQQYVPPSTLTQASSGTVKSYQVTVVNSQFAQKTFILSSSDYISLYQTELSSLISSNPVSVSPNATLSQVLSYIATVQSTTPSSTAPGTANPAPTGSTTNVNTQAAPQNPPSTGSSTPIQQTININGQAMPVLTPTGGSAIYTVVTKNSDGTVNLLTNYGGVTQTFQNISISEVQFLESAGATVNDPNGLLTAPTPAPGNVTLPGNLNQNPSTPTGQQTIPTDPITQQNLNTIIEQSAIQNPLSTGGQKFNKSSLSSNPIGVGIAFFVGLLGLSIAVPSGLIPKQLKRKRGNKK